MRSIRIIFLIALFIGLLATFPVTTEAQFEQIWGGTNGKTCLITPGNICKESNGVGVVSSGGTAFLIAPDLILTNAHVSDPPNNTFAVHFKFNTSKNLWGNEESPNWHWTAERYASLHTNGADIALLRLQEPVGLKYGYFPISNDIPEVGNTVYHIGHPNFGIKKVSRNNSQQQSNVYHSKDKDIKYYASTALGNSGSPIIHNNKVIGLVYGVVYEGGANAIGHTFRNQALFNRIKEEVEKSITRTKSFDITNKESVTIKEYQLPIELRATSQKGTSLRLKDPNGKFELGSKSGGWWIRGLYAGFNPIYELRLKAGETLTKTQHTVTVIHSPGFYGKGGTEKTVYINTESTSTATAPSPFAMHQLRERYERKVTKQRNSLTTTWGAIKIQ